MRQFFALVLIFGMLLTAELYSQENGRKPAGQIAGTIVYSNEKKPVEYANIILFSKKDSTQITGTTSDHDGYFKLEGLRPGLYYCEILFIGYHAKTLENISIGRGNLAVDLGEILLTEETLSLETVEVEAQRVPIQYQIDKKIINVAGQPTAISGTAVDVLENVPSVTVDIEGNVSLRGSSNFTVLIDGRPSVLDADEILHQIPASSIENIEIITNPSAKYNPEGSSGIINILMKKSRQNGRNGIINLNAGLEDKQGIDFILNVREEDYNIAFGADYNNRAYPGTMERETMSAYNNVTRFINSDGSSSRERDSYGVKGSIGYQFNSKNLIDLSVRYGGRSHQRISNVDFEEWGEPDAGHNFYLSSDKSERSGDFYAANVEYQHHFKKKDHVLKSEISYRFRESDEESVNELFNLVGDKTDGQRFVESGPSHNYDLKVDYTLPLDDKRKFEAGAKSEYDFSEEETGRYAYNPAQDSYEYLTQYSHLIKYHRNIHSVYTLYSGEWNTFGYQAGLRGELTDRLIQLNETGDEFSINRWDYFPTMHMSYKFSTGQQLMASFTRRIERPRGWALEPFETWMDAYNIRRGNPSLKPEYVHSYETGLQTFFGKNIISTDVYYRITNNKIERVQSVYAENITLHSTDNIGKDYSFGTEIMINADITKWWNMNLMGNFYKYKIEGELSGTYFTRESNNWNSRLNHAFKIGKRMRIQVNGIYNSQTVSSQGTREGFFITNVAVRQEFLNKQLSATLQISDIFETGKYEFTSTGNNFYSYNKFTREAPVVMLNVSYNINNYKVERKRQNNQDNNMDDEGDY